MSPEMNESDSQLSLDIRVYYATTNIKSISNARKKYFCRSPPFPLIFRVFVDGVEPENRRNPINFGILGSSPSKNP